MSDSDDNTGQTPLTHAMANEMQQSGGLLNKAALNLSFLLSVVRCGESLSEDEEGNVRSVIAELQAADREK